MAEVVRPGIERAAAGIISRIVEPHRPALDLVLLAVLCYLPAVWLRDLWNPDEPRYAEVVRVMGARGDYVLPHLNGEVYGEKPPLFFWLGAMAGRLPGVPAESGPRLISALAGLGTLLLTFRLGRRLADARTGWLAALVLATSSMFLVHASSGVIDGTLTFLVVAALSVALRAREASSPVLWAMFYLLAGLAILTKGPVGLAVPAGVLLLLSVREEGLPGAVASHAVWGTLLMAAVAAAWLVPAIAQGGREYADVILFKQNVGRAWQSWHHKEPVQFFLKVFPASFFPWIVVLPTALYGAWKARASQRAASLGLAWFVFTFVFFSVISGKKTRYLLPLFPAASLLVALELRALLPEARRVRSALRDSIPLAVSLAIVALGGLVLAAAPFGMAGRLIARTQGLAPDQLAGLLWYTRAPGALLVALPGLVLVALGAAGLAWILRDRRASLGCLMGGWILAVIWAQWVGVPALDLVKSARPLAAAVSRAVGRDGDVALYREGYAGIFNVYLEREQLPVISGVEKIVAFAMEHPRGAIISTAEDLERLRGRLELETIVPCRRLGADTVCASRPAAVQPSRTSRE